MNVVCPTCYGKKVVQAIVNDKLELCGCGECGGTGEVDEDDIHSPLGMTPKKRRHYVIA